VRESTISKHRSWGARSAFAAAVGQTLRTERRRLRLSQRELAGGFSASFVSRVELGDAVPSLPALAYMADRIGLSLADFFDRVADRLE
jgi:transcriptional regulator with XRE-family HTH domain